MTAPIAYIPVLGQSNAKALKNFGGDYDSGCTEIQSALLASGQVSTVKFGNYAVGNSTVDGDSFYYPTRTDLIWWYPESNTPGQALLDAVASMRADLTALSGQDVKVSVVWGQGESNAEALRLGISTPETYKEATVEIFRYIEQELGVDMEFFIMQTGRYNNISNQPPSYVEGKNLAHAAIQQAQAELATEHADIHLAAITKDLEMRDDMHLSFDAYEIAGHDIGESMVKFYDKAPQLANPLMDQRGIENLPFNFTLPIGSFTDADARQPLVYSATLSNGDALPEWINFNAASGQFSIDPAGHVGNVAITVIATDEYGKTAQDVFVLTIDSATPPNVNAAPVLDNTSPAAFPAITEDVVTAANTGIVIANLLGARAQDDTNAAPGIAVIVADNANGSWEYRTSSGNWQALGTVGVNNALLLSAQASLRFLPAKDYFGLVILSYVAWDGSSGIEGGYADAATRGGQTAFSIQSATSTLAVTPVVDTLLGGTANDSIQGTMGDDSIRGGAGADTLLGAAGNDTVYGENGNDSIEGGTGNDTLWGDAGNDTIHGGDGTDSIEGGNDNDLLYGGEGDNTVIGGNGNDSLFGGSGNDSLNGGSGDDTVYGAGGNDNIIGHNGADILWGEAGDDSLMGYAQNDTLIGGAGADAMWGGENADRFVWTQVTDSGLGALLRDGIRDFSKAEGDKLDFSAWSGMQFIGTSNFSGTAREIMYQVSSSNTFLYVDSNMDGIRDMEVQLKGVIALIADDFIL